MRTLLRIMLFLILSLLVLFALDCAVFGIRQRFGRGTGTVQVDHFLATSLKGNKTELHYLGTVNQNCSRTLFPQYAASQWNSPCWWLEQHRTRWQTI